MSIEAFHFGKKMVLFTLIHGRQVLTTHQEKNLLKLKKNFLEFINHY